jgi:hypothetical protein
MHGGGYVTDRARHGHAASVQAIFAAFDLTGGLLGGAAGRCDAKTATITWRFGTRDGNPLAKAARPRRECELARCADGITDQGSGRMATGAARCARIADFAAPARPPVPGGAGVRE